ncbi:MAG: hypothetical protein ABII07_03710, partial [Patescibacteria group bacterium]
ELSEMGADALLEVVLGFEKFSPMKQDNGQATYCKKITRKSGEVSLDDPGLMQKYRAYYGWPGIYTFLDGKRVKITEMQDGEITKLQPEGKKEMSLEEFERGYGRITPAH